MWPTPDPRFKPDPAAVGQTLPPGACSDYSAACLQVLKRDGNRPNLPFTVSCAFDSAIQTPEAHDEPSERQAAAGIRAALILCRPVRSLLQKPVVGSSRRSALDYRRCAVPSPASPWMRTSLVRKWPPCPFGVPYGSKVPRPTANALSSAPSHELTADQSWRVDESWHCPCISLRTPTRTGNGALIALGQTSSCGRSLAAS